MKIQATSVKQLRDKTGLAMMLCKKALESSDGDLEKALDFLKKQNKLVKSGSASAKEGAIVIAVEDQKNSVSKATIMEINSNTDFVARNEKFQKLAREISDISIGVSNLEELLKSNNSNGESVENFLIENSNVIGEKILLNRMEKITSKGTIGYYVHNQLGDNIGKMASIVSLEEEDHDVSLRGEEQYHSKGNQLSEEELLILKKYADQIAMHIVASKPLALDKEHLDKSFLEKEKEILTQQAQEKSQKKPIIENIVKGKMNKLFEEIVLLDQPFVLDNNTSIRNFLEKISKELGKNIKLSNYYRMEIGEEQKIT